MQWRHLKRVMKNEGVAVGVAVVGLEKKKKNTPVIPRQFVEAPLFQTSCLEDF